MSIEYRSPHPATKPVSRLPKYKLALLIDDNYIDNFISRQLLTACDFSKETIYAVNGQLALDLLHELIAVNENGEQQYPDIIFVDLNMPVMNGIEFIREFYHVENEHQKMCKIVVLTSSIHGADKAEVLKINSDIKFINKPLTTEMLDIL